MGGLKDPIPAGPFIAWLTQRFLHYRDQELKWCPSLSTTGAAVKLGKEIGWEGPAGQRRLYDFRNGVKRKGHGNASGGPRLYAELALVEDALWRAGVEFWEVYPEEQYPALYRDIPPEPACWCPNCAREQQPVLGYCETCDWRMDSAARGEVAA